MFHVEHLIVDSAAISVRSIFCRESFSKKFSSSPSQDYFVMKCFSKILPRKKFFAAKFYES